MPIYLPNVVTYKINSWLFMNILHSSRFAVKNGQTHGQAHLCILNNASIINSTSSVCSMISKIFKDFKIMVIFMSANVSGNPWLSHRYCLTDASKMTKPMARLKFREISKFSIASPKCHFWGEIIKVITNSGIFMNLPYIWFSRFSWKWLFLWKILKIYIR